jgi:hypothetical protein
MTKQLAIFTAIILTAISSLTYAQSADSVKASRLIITTSLTDYMPTISLYTGTFNIGTEIYLKKRTSIYTNIGIIKSYGESGETFGISALSTRGVKTQVEGRFYLNKRKIFQPAILLFWPHIFQFKTKVLQNTGYYVAFHSFYQWTTTERGESVVKNSIPEKHIYNVNRNAAGLNILFGYQCVKKYGLTVDYSVGLGGQFIQSSSKNRIGTGTNWPYSEKEIFSNKLFDKGTAFSPSFVYQMRVGWAICK